jgi:hypothetical protein
VNAVEGRPTTEYLQFVDRFPSHKRAQKATETQHVVQVAVRQKYPRQVPEADSRLQDLPLRPLTAIDQEAVLIVLHDLRRQPAPR